MRVWDEMYGSDADGNRGVMITCYELEGTKVEREEIAVIIYDNFIEGNASGTLHIKFEGVSDVEVEIEDYIVELLAIAKDDKTITDDF